MKQNPAASDWAAARGEKWRAQLTGMEAMLAPVDPVLIQALDLDGPYRIADLACGGGGTTVEILRRAPKAGQKQLIAEVTEWAQERVLAWTHGMTCFRSSPMES